MKMKMKLLASTVSLLCFGQVAAAAPCDNVVSFCSTITTAGITKTFEFPTAADAQAAADNAAAGNPSADQVAAFSDPNSGNLIPQTNAGLTTQTVVNGQPVTLIQTANIGSNKGGSTVVVQPGPNGTQTFTTISKPATDTSTTSLASYVNSFLKGTPVAGTVTPGIDTAAYAQVQRTLADVQAAQLTNPADPLAAQNAAAKALTATNTSTALISTVPTEAPIQSTITVNGVTINKTFATQAEAQAFANNQAANRNLFADPVTGKLPSNSIGQFVQAVTGGIPTLYTQTDAKTIVVAQPGLNGTFTYTTLTSSAATATTVNSMISAYLSGDPAAFAATGASATVGIKDPTTLAAVQTTLTTANTKGTLIKGVGVTLAKLTSAPTFAVSTTPADVPNLITTAEAANLAALSAIINDPNASAQAKADALAKLKAALAAETSLTPTAVAAIEAAAQAIVDAATTPVVPPTPPVKATLDQATTVAQQKLQELKSALGTGEVTKDADSVLKRFTDLQTRVNAGDATVTQADVTAAAQATVNLLAQAKTSQYQAQKTRASGVAGNPVSIMNMTVDGMFNQAADYGQAENKTNLVSASSDNGMKASVSAGLQYGYYDLGGKSANTVTLPLSAAMQLTPKGQVVLTVPLSYIQTQNQSDAYQVGATLAYKYNVSDNWTITPAASYAYRSFDNQQNNAFANPLSSTSMVGGSVSSKYTWNLAPQAMKVSLTNMIGYFESLDSNSVSASNVNFGLLGSLSSDPTIRNSTISNYVIKNGLHATKSLGNFNVGAYFTDTHYFGSALYFDQFNEVGFSVKPQNSGRYLDALSVDANYLFSIAGKHSSELDGFRLNINYKY